MPQFPGEYTVAGPVSPATQERFGELVPLDLSEAWRDQGQLITGDGFIRAIDPEPLLGVMDTILPAIPGAIPLFATAWGDLVVMHPEDRRLTLALFRYGFYTDYLTMPVLAFEQLVIPEAQRTILQRGIYDQAVSVLGVPAIDECFGYVLPLALGGADEVSNITRRPLVEHLQFLVQSGGPPRHLDEVSPQSGPAPVPAEGPGAATSAAAEAPGAVEEVLDRPASVPTPQESDLIAHGKGLLEMLNPNTDFDYESLPELNAVYLWQNGFGGGQLIIGEDRSVLYGNSSLWRDPLIEIWRTGKRTPIEDFEQAAGGRDA